MILYDATVLTRFVAAIFAASGSSEEEANIVAESLVAANLVGHDSHGVIRVAQYMDWLAKDWVRVNQTPEVVTDEDTMVVIDGGFGYGQVIAKHGIRVAAERAKKFGLCVVSLRNTSHVGRLGAWAETLAGEGLVSLHFSNTSGFGIRIAPFGGVERRFSTNPICIGAPRPGRFPIIFDAATAKVPEGKILVAINEGETLDEGLILDGNGEPTCDPNGFFDEPQGAILPIAGHKGSGLAFMIEVLAGALTGGKSSHPDNSTAKMVVNNLFSIVIDPDRLSGREFFSDDVERLIGWTKSSRPAVPGGGVLVPGEMEFNTKTERQRTGIPIDDATNDDLLHQASVLGVKSPATAQRAAAQ